MYDRPVAGLIAFPNPVNEKAARTVAAGVLVLSIVMVSSGAWWIAAVLAYGFAARVLSGPTLSPLGQLATRVVRGLDFPPVRRYLVCGINGFARDQLPDRGERQVELAQHRDETRVFELRDVVVAIARDLIDACGNQYAAFVVKTERLHRQT